MRQLMRQQAPPAERVRRILSAGEHDMLAPEGGDKGGNLIAKGTPEEVADNKKSYTGHYLRKMLDK